MVGLLKVMFVLYAACGAANAVWIGYYVSIGHPGRGVINLVALVFISIVATFSIVTFRRHRRWYP